MNTPQFSDLNRNIPLPEYFLIYKDILEFFIPISTIAEFT